MSLKNQVTEHMKDAMRAKDTARLGAVRLLLAAVKQREVDERIELTAKTTDDKNIFSLKGGRIQKKYFAIRVLSQIFP